MNWDTVEGNWTEFKGRVKAKWGKLTDDDLTVIDGHQDQLIGLLQKRYGYLRDAAEREVKEFCSECSTCS